MQGGGYEKARKNRASGPEKSPFLAHVALISQRSAVNFSEIFPALLLCTSTAFLITQYVHYLALANKRRLKSALSHDCVLC